MKQYLALIAIALFVLSISFGSSVGCGGGSGGSSGSTSSTDGSTDGGTSSNPASEIEGQIVRSNSSVGIPGVRVVFVDANGLVVGEATSRSNGWFDADLPASAVRFQLDPTTIDVNSFSRAYRYNNLWYTPLTPTCTAPLPTITPGTRKQLPGGAVNIPLKSSVPPPPTGCPQ